MTDRLNQHTEPEGSAVAFERQRKRKVMLVALVLGLLCALFIWQLFSSDVSSSEADGSINVTVPEGRAERTESDKRKASEQVRSSSQQNQRMQTLGDNSFSLLDEGLKPTVPNPGSPDPVQQAEQANRALQAQVHSFYAQPKRNDEAEQLRQQIEALKVQLNQTAPTDPLSMIEEQYKLARKYLGGGTQDPAGDSKQSPDRKSRTQVMRPLQGGTVEASTLNPTLTDFATERNLGFLTATQDPTHSNPPTVRACIAQSQKE